MHSFDKLVDWLYEPTHASTLGCFRVMLGLNFLLQSFLWAELFEKFERAAMLFPYPLLAGVPRLSPVAGERVLNVLAVSSVSQGETDRGFRGLT
jgi:hypothetical protein